jgi:hypothetical protein
MKVLPGMNVVLGRTQAEAEDKKAAIDNAETMDQRVRFLSFRTGIAVEILRERVDTAFPFDQLNRWFCKNPRASYRPIIPA